MAKRSNTAGRPTPSGAVPDGFPKALIKPAKKVSLADLPVAGGGPVLESMGVSGGGADGDTRVLDGLRALGYSTVEDVLGVLQVAGREIARALGVSTAELDTFVGTIAGSAASAVSAAEQTAIDQSTYPLGEALDHIPSTVAAPTFDITIPNLLLGAAPPAANVNLIPQCSPIKNQGDRGTCVAFASVAVLEHQYLRLGTPVSFSEQFLYWACKANDQYPGVGTWIDVAFKQLDQAGVCLSGAWNYNPKVVPGNEGQGPPPAAALRGALGYRLTNSYQRLAPTAVDDIKASLRSNRAVAFAIPVYNTLMLNDAAKKSGDIPNPAPGEIRVGGHAMCFVGYVDDPTTPGIGGGRFIIRNSWGNAFGFASQYGAGYGTISYAYIDRLGAEAYTVN